jgi:hypothetical protein
VILLVLWACALCGNMLDTLSMHSANAAVS